MTLPTATPPSPSFWDANGGDLIVGLLLLLAGIFIARPLEAFGKWLWTKIKAAFEAAGFGFERPYLKALAEQHQWLKLIGIYNQTDLNRPHLQNVFISLRLAASAAEDDGPRFGWEKIFDDQKTPIVILGHPGAGKSTLLDYLTLVFCGHIANPLRKKLGEPLPLYAPLRDLGGANRPSLLEILQAEDNTGLKKIPKGYFESRLRRKGCIVFLDGLDEVLDPLAHDRAVAEIQCFLNEYPGNRVVVTCRVAGWRGQLPGWCVYQVQDCDANDIQRFIGAWYREVLRTQAVNKLGPQPDPAKVAEAEKKAYAAALTESTRLWDALRKNEGLLRIARTPLILSLITLVHKTRSDLPKGRARLYHECLEILLEKWDMVDKGLRQPDAPSLKDKLLALQQIATIFLRRAVVEMDAEGLEQLLVPLLPSMARSIGADDFLRQIVERSGVLVETRMGVYGFAHRALADQLAANLLVEEGLDLELMPHAAEERWREVILIAAGLVSQDRAEKLVSALLEQGSESAASLAVAGWSLVEDIHISTELRRRVKAGLIAGLDSTHESAGFTLLAEALVAADPTAASEWIAAVLAGSDETKRLRTLSLLPELNPETGAAFMPLLAQILGDAREVPALRARAALALVKFPTQADAGVWQALQTARQPQNEYRVKAAATWAWCELGRYAELGLVQVPAGEFLMGSAPEMDGSAFGDEEPQHSLYLPTFYISRYPVTLSQWRTYRQESGEGNANSPDTATPETHPVDDIAWKQALSFARWYGYALPSEAEWEKAARGSDGRIYPWGSLWRAGLANTAEYWQNGWLARLARILRRNTAGGTTPVGKFSPGGDSPYGCADMAGNTWEWTRSRFQPYPYLPQDGREDLEQEDSRVVRGGSFYYNRRSARCAFRNDDDLSYNIGFRVVVVSPIFTSDL